MFKYQAICLFSICYTSNIPELYTTILNIDEKQQQTVNILQDRNCKPSIRDPTANNNKQLSKNIKTTNLLTRTKPYFE